MKYVSIIASLLFVAALPLGAGAAEEVTATSDRYRAYEQSSGAYELYEVRPSTSRQALVQPEVRSGAWQYAPAASSRSRPILADAHQGVKFYQGRSCVHCHAEMADTMHVARNDLTCRQCHGAEPISSVDHYYSPLHIARRHAYVCAKCHEGASISFATYDIHEPNPAMASTLGDFPALFWGFWIMVGLAVLTFGLFLPHTALWGLRELLSGGAHAGEQAKEEKP